MRTNPSTADKTHETINRAIEVGPADAATSVPVDCHAIPVESPRTPSMLPIVKRTRVILLASLVGCAGILAHAQSKPDFAGRWTSDPNPAAAVPAPAGPGRGGGRGDMGSGWGSTITITQDASKLTVEYAFFGRGDMQPPLKFVYALDGSQTKNSIMMGRGIQEETSKTEWGSDRLAITTVHTFPNPENGQPVTSEVKRVLFLESPTSLVVETTRTGVLGGAASTTRTVYRKM
jgi:arylsulfatase